MNKNVKVVLWLMAAFGLTFAEASMAASVLDTTMTTAINTGFTDLKDTVKDVLTISWPFMLGIIALLASPKLVKKMVSAAGARG